MSTSDIDRQIDQLRRCEYLKESEVKALCAKAREILVDESNVQRVDAPVTVSEVAPARWWAPSVPGYDRGRPSLPVSMFYAAWSATNRTRVVGHG